MRKWIKRIVGLVVVLGAIGVAAGWYARRGGTQQVSFTTVQVTRGDLLATIDASGTLEPEEVVDVGAQVGGKIVEFGTDSAGQTIDYGSEIEEGILLARIDDDLSQADVDEAKAELQSAEAGVQLAKADLSQLEAQLAQAERDWKRAQKLGPSEALSQASYDSYQSAYEIAAANVEVGKASILQAEATLAQAKTNLWRAERNLGYCTITSPVKGVVIDRRVNVGQTVVASMDVPSLFLIAKDLTKMQVWVAVNEADVASIYPGQPVAFTVDALPDLQFRGTVGKVRLNASMTNNVVTYTVEIVTDNPDGVLLPYLTANVSFEVARRDDVLLVPAAALRWTPSVEQVAPEYRETSEVAPDAPADGEAPPEEPDDSLTPGVIYVEQGQYVRPVPVLVGLSSDGYTEIQGKDLAEGMKVVTGVEVTSSAAGSDEASNPFTPKMPSPPKGGGGPPR